MKEEDKRKHLEFIQLVITRMNVNSFLLKGWTVTLVAALFAFAAKDADIRYIFINFLVVPIFWVLDGYYLSQERQYRGLYDEVRVKEVDKIDYSMNATDYNIDKGKWCRCVLSKTILVFYLLIIAAILIVYLLTNG